MPTPVSALIHAATLVTAGIYLMVRLGPFMAGSDLVILVGCLTAFMAGVFGFFQADLKRVIAFSTCSQLGCPQNISISNLNWSADPYVAPLRSAPNQVGSPGAPPQLSRLTAEAGTRRRVGLNPWQSQKVMSPERGYPAASPHTFGMWTGLGNRCYSTTPKGDVGDRDIFFIFRG